MFTAVVSDPAVGPTAKRSPPISPFRLHLPLVVCPLIVSRHSKFRCDVETAMRSGQVRGQRPAHSGDVRDPRIAGALRKPHRQTAHRAPSDVSTRFQLRFPNGRAQNRPRTNHPTARTLATAAFTLAEPSKKGMTIIMSRVRLTGQYDSVYHQPILPRSIESASTS